MKIAITGSTGLLGTRITKLLEGKHTFIHLMQDSLDITNREGTQAFFDSIDFDVVLHLAAYTNVDGAETQKELARAINVDGTRNVADALRKRNKHFIYISTDFVFDGKNPPYFEDSTPSPSGYYAQSKYEGEECIKDFATIVRISYPYGNPDSPRPDFVTRLKTLLSEGKELTMITDGSMTPTFIDDITYGLDHLFENQTAQIVHLVGSQPLSPYDVGIKIARRFGFSEKLIIPVTYAEYIQGKAPRPQYGEIRTKNNTFLKMKSFDEGLLLI